MVGEWERAEKALEGLETRVKYLEDHIRRIERLLMKLEAEVSGLEDKEGRG